MIDQAFPYYKNAAHFKWYSGQEPACQCKRHRLDPWSQEDFTSMMSNKFIYNYWAYILEPAAIANEEVHEPRAVPRNEKPLQWKPVHHN